MSRSILCAIDISQPEHDVAVLTRAKQLADLDGARLDVITVVPDYGFSVVGQAFSQDHHDQMVTKAKQLLLDFVGEVIGDKANETVRHVVATGKAYAEILKAGKAAGSDLIVIGSHTPELKDYLLGPNAARVVRHSDCSVYVVR